MKRRLIEAGFPCHQVGAETQRERDTGQAPPPNRLHVWWARRPLTPSRAAIIASLDPEGTDPETFVRQLGIEKKVMLLEGQPWTLTGKLLERIVTDNGSEQIVVDDVLLRAFATEQKQRRENLALITELKAGSAEFARDPVIQRWEKESQPLPEDVLRKGELLEIRQVMGDPAWSKTKLAFAKQYKFSFPGDAYGYPRAFSIPTLYRKSQFTVLDPTSGGGSIPFEALRLGHNVIANELNPVATIILFATLEYPACYGVELADDIQEWGNKLLNLANKQLYVFFADEQTLPDNEKTRLEQHLLPNNQYLSPEFNKEFIQDYLYTRQVTCPHCNGEAPLLNTCWLSKESGDPWGVKVITDGSARNGKVRFETYRVSGGKGPNGEDPAESTVNRGVGQCVHCRQAIDGDEIKRQARGESEHGSWQDRLYAVVAIRHQPKLDKQGQPQYFKSGAKKGLIKTEKVRFFRAVNQRDLDALAAAREALAEKWDAWDVAGLIPTEKFPQGNDMRPVNYGMPRWCDLFTPRQLLGHLTLVEGLNSLKPEILQALGSEKGRAVITYLQFAIDKGIDYNSRQTRWIAQRGQVSGTFGRHDFSLKWTFGEMIFTGPSSGAAWGLSQILDAYRGIAQLVSPLHELQSSLAGSLKIINGTAASMPAVPSASVDLVCMDPPYYNNVQYAELSDYFYVWQKRTLKDLYPDIYSRRLTDKNNEAVANPVRDGSAREAKTAYERMMSEIFSECRRTLKDDGLLTLMFTHKSQDAWETLTRSLIESHWIITASFPVDSEFANSMNIMDQASAVSSIFITCRKRHSEAATASVWQGFGGQGVQKQIEQAVLAALDEFIPLQLNPVDEMVACYGRALQVLSENWPVMDGDELVNPVRAMNEASRVVAQNRVGQITQGKISVAELDSETAMALTIYGIWGHAEVAYNDILNLSRSLGIRLETKTGGYGVNDHEIGINPAVTGNRARQAGSEEQGYQAPLLKKGAKIRLALPEERDSRRLDAPQTGWDCLHGLLQAYRKGDIPVARAYLQDKSAGNPGKMLALLSVWSREATDPELRKEAEAMLYGLSNLLEVKKC